MEIKTSFGDIFDKLTILDIKLKNINEQYKLNDINKERQYLLSIVNNQMANGYIKYLYNCLYHINMKIYIGLIDIRSINRSSNNDYLEILEWNDMRFRIKNKINIFLDSLFKEHKGYKVKKVLLLSHLGMGDQITINGAVNELSFLYDEVVVVSKQIHKNNMEKLYQHDKSISILYINDDVDISPNYGSSIDKLLNFKNNNYDLFLTSSHKHPIGNNPLKKVINESNEFYEQFYCDIGLDHHDRKIYTYIPRYNLQIELYNKLINICKNYIFIHNKGNFEVEFNYDNDNILYFSVNENFYKNFPHHKFYNVWEEFGLYDLLDYVKIIENAKELYMTDSSFFCLSSVLQLTHIEIKKVYIRKKYYTLKNWSNYINEWSIN